MTTPFVSFTSSHTKHFKYWKLSVVRDTVDSRYCSVGHFDRAAAPMKVQQAYVIRQRHSWVPGGHEHALGHFLRLLIPGKQRNSPQSPAPIKKRAKKDRTPARPRGEVPRVRWITSMQRKQKTKQEEGAMVPFERLGLCEHNLIWGRQTIWGRIFQSIHGYD